MCSPEGEHETAHHVLVPTLLSLSQQGACSRRRPVTLTNKDVLWGGTGAVYEATDVKSQATTLEIKTSRACK